MITCHGSIFKGTGTVQMTGEVPIAKDQYLRSTDINLGIYQVHREQVMVA
jgi:hypothetical protein